MMPADPPGPRDGRYARVPVGYHTGTDGRMVVYLRRRFLPQPEALTGVQEHVVRDGDRPDHIAARYLGDPLLSWRLCDANRVLDPQTLTTTPGRRLAITLPSEFSTEPVDDA